MTRKIKKQQIHALLKEVTKEYNTFVPMKELGQDVVFQTLPKDTLDLNNALKKLSLDYDDIVISPKDIFFPQVEEMFEIKNNAVKETIESSSKFLFGVRPCDLKGILFVDDFFKRNFDDVYYQTRAKNRFIVAIGCIKPPRPQSCFCTSAKTGPFAEGGFDLQFIDSTDSYLVEVGSKKGEDFLKKYSQFFTAIEALDTIKEIKEKAQRAVELKVDFQKALNLMADDKFIPEEKYKEIGERCIYCGACLYTCPTCTCFNVFDDVDKNKEGVRSRNWDGCVFEGYTRESSGHNPRKEKYLRTCRRYEHKLKFDYKTTEMSSCIGCGRCLSSCPVKLGMSKFIEEITAQNKKEEEVNSEKRISTNSGGN